mmetsp:Transcript_27781/g.39754  ORF Transcript_27781/g.39754 Transcript_27781/m.39754 type:complete len:531 (-) Transcript_27781:8-1600(-)
MRYDLAFFLCCCKSFLHSSTRNSTDYYELLGIDKDASQDDVKRAYKKQSLQMHPDKLAQRGMTVTEVDQERFQKMKEAYEVLSDTHKRETYDAIGEKGLKWLEEPFSIDPQEMARNFANSSPVDRAKIFGIFVGIAFALFLLPILICLQIDGSFGQNASWVAVLTPLWIANIFMIWYHFRVISMGPIPKPDGVPDHEWVDPLPMSKRYFSLLRFLLFCVLEVLIALKLSNSIDWTWLMVFSPLLLHEATTLSKKVPLARMKIVTVEDLEKALAKPFEEFTTGEKELIAKRYSVVPSIVSVEFETAHRLKGRARQDCIKVFFRIAFLTLLIVHLDYNLNWNWWLIFSPFWIMSVCICCGSCHKFREAHAVASEKDPALFGASAVNGADGPSATNYGAMEDGTPGSAPPISEASKEEVRAEVIHAGYKLIGSFVSQIFVLVIVGLFVAKLQGAGYSTLWVLFPLLMVAGVILCCLGCTIFCITDISDETGDLSGQSGSNQYVPPEESSDNNTTQVNQVASISGEKTTSYDLD